VIKINFYLHSFVSQDGNSPIYCRVYADGQYDLRAAIHEQIKKKNWSDKKQSVKEAQEYADIINQRLERIKNKVAKDFREKLDAGQSLTIQDLKNIIRPPQVIEIKETVSDVYEDWKTHYLTEKNEGNTTDKINGANYTRRFVQVISRLNEFKLGVTLQEIDASFLKKYRSYLISENLQDVTIQNHIKSIRVLLEYKGMPTHFVKSPKTADPTKHALSWPEVLQLATADYNTKRVKEIALCFVANCQICLRFSDLHKINTNMTEIETTKYGKVMVINLNQQKTGAPIFIPIPPRALSIIKKYGKLPLPKFDKNSSSFAFNTWLKQAAKEAELNRLVRTTKVINGNIIEEWVPLYEQISSHDARHTGYSRVKEASKVETAEAQVGHVKAGAYDQSDPAIVVTALLDAWKIIDPQI